ncbi:hypothetical protein BDQ94DRAFT_152298 [Aspergillus welwitschiae]|uniref:Uncharacterized protein n=1 Tax=Aspergillus welwitschiae TaxID=1341132 RepID=A0A3F3PMQ4_9EURO|nr:hypothetical protein BDQ94DRAFT_152298 [Aspergillus welwitschiae]RDH28207.1 hypothetical protein BDQ94DRAFT_152298 [Aspergillus welwitschiae]
MLTPLCLPVCTQWRARLESQLHSFPPSPSALSCGFFFINLLFQFLLFCCCGHPMPF